MMKIVVTGASGFVGRHIVPQLSSLGHKVIVVGRHPQQLSELFPDLVGAVYDEYAKICVGADMVVHLAAANNDKAHGCEAFQAVNVDLTRQLALEARNAGVPIFANISTFHALPRSPRSDYGSSKRAGAEAIRDMNGIRTVTAFLPLVHATPGWNAKRRQTLMMGGDCWTGSASILNRLPLKLGTMLFSLSSAFKPTVHVTQLVLWIHAGAQESLDQQVWLADDQSCNRLYRLAVRSLDWLAVTFAVLLLWWLYFIVWISVRATSRGPGFFSQLRVGKDGMPFTCYKFRTMRVGTPNVATHNVDAAQITPIGRILRSTKIDELPQLWNVGRGEMSLVGPRPCLPSQTELVELRRQHRVLEVEPGITGYAQINDIAMQDAAKLTKYDLIGLHSRSITSMVSTLIQTLLPRKTAS